MDTQDYAACIAAPFAVIGLRLDGDAICEIDFLPMDTPLKAPASAAARRAVAAIEAYLDGNQEAPPALSPARGTPFQRRVWQALRRIPAGEVRSYGQLAADLGSSPRAVGGACRANPIPLLIPCHRVVARQGLGGFAGRTTGFTLDIKRWLLDHEGVKLGV